MDDQQRTVALARRVVAELAPHELPMFDVTCQAYLATPARLRARARRDDMIGFGVDVVVPLLTGAALTATGAALQIIAQQGGEWWGRRLVRRLGGRTAEPAVPASEIPSELIAQVRATAHRQALAFDLPEQQARLLADAIVGGLLHTER